MEGTPILYLKEEYKAEEAPPPATPPSPLGGLQITVSSAMNGRVVQRETKGIVLSAVDCLLRVLTYLSPNVVVKHEGLPMQMRITYHVHCDRTLHPNLGGAHQYLVSSLFVHLAFRHLQ